MGVLNVRETWTGDTGGWRRDDSGPTSEVVRRFTVTLDNSGQADVSIEILADSRIPQDGDSHPRNEYYICRGCDVTQRFGPTMVEVESYYEARTSTKEKTPLDEPPEIRFDSVISMEEVDEDIYGNPIVTANGEPVLGVQSPISDLTMVITRNLPDYDPVAIRVFNNTVNSVSFFGAPPGVVYCRKLSASSNTSQVSDQTFRFFTVTGEFQFRQPIVTSDAKAWWARVRHEGFMISVENPFTAGEFDIVHARDGARNKVTRPVMLKPDGTAETDPTVAHWLEFPVIRTADHNAIGLL